jgi:PAS domain S-box-containing protein
LVELAADAMCVHDGQRLLWVNQSFVTLTGYDTAQQMVGLPMVDLVPPADHDAVRERIRELGDARPVREVEQVLRRRDGTPVPVELRSAPCAGGFVVIARAISHREATEARRDEAADRFRELFHHMPVGLWEEDLSGTKRILDGLGIADPAELGHHLAAHPEVLLACAAAIRILDVNPTACAIAGARDQAELLANLDKIFLPESLPDIADEIVQLWSGRKRVVVDGWNGTLQGDRRWVAVSTELADGHARDWSRAIVTTVDITERRRANEERLALRERLHEAEKLEAIGRLAGGVAHDFNNILSAVLGFAELTLLEVAPSTAAHDAQLRIIEAARRARDLVRQILTVGRRDQPQAQRVDVATLTGEALSLVRAGIPVTVALESHIDAAAGVCLLDPSQLHQIVLNLCSNARDAVGDRGRIEVSVEPVSVGRDLPTLRPGRYVRLRVRDDGVGMDDATRARLFEPYMTTKGGSGGHGLGLAVVRGIVTSTGGAILVDSKPREGTTFDVYLPRLSAGPSATEEREVAAPRGSERILVVDDERAVRAVHLRLLQSLGYDVLEAADAEAALEVLARERIDLVLTDQTMPRVTGAELAKMIRATRPEVRIVLCSGYNDAVDDADIAAMGIRAMLQKPVDRARLAEVVRSALGG